MFEAIPELLRNLKFFNRRKDTRFEATKNIEGVCEYFEYEQLKDCKCWICNISKGGLLITTGEVKIFPGRVITIKIKLSEDKVNSVRGKIIRTYRSKKQEWYYNAIRFLNAQDLENKELFNYILDKCQAKPLTM